MSNVFDLVSNSHDMVVIRVVAKDNLTVAMNPYISLDYDYISLTKGDNHILTVIKKNGSTFSFHWGINGYTLISDSLEMLQRKVVSFIEDECYIPISLKEPIKSIKLYKNNNFGQWQLTFNNGNAIIRSKTALSLDSAKDWARNFVHVKDWVHRIAPTGIDVWDGVM